MRRRADRVVGSIGPGLLCLVGVCDGDTAKDEEWARNRVVGIRLWTDPETGKRWQKSVKDMGYELLLVSQFTLHGYAKGNKPDFHYASACCLRAARAPAAHRSRQWAARTRALRSTALWPL